MRYFLGFLGPAVAFLQSLSLPGLFPAFLSSDFSPYLSTPVYSPGPLSFNVTSSSSYQVMVNSTYVGSFTGNKTVNLPALSIGTHALTISNGEWSYLVTVLVGGNQVFTHNVTTGGRSCAPNCTILPTETWTVTANSLVQVMVFDGMARETIWVPLLGSQAFPSAALDNYLLVREGAGIMLYAGFKTPKANQPAYISWKTQAYGNFTLSPRFHPQVTSYILVPMLESSVGFGVSVKTGCVSACGISLDSSSGLFSTITPSLDTWSSTALIQSNDTLIVSYRDPSGTLSPQYYAVSVNVKSRDRFLKMLKVVVGTQGDSYAAAKNSDALLASVVGTQAPFNEAFNSIRLLYTLQDLDYSRQSALVVITDTSSPFSSLSIQTNSTQPAPYWSSAKVYSPLIGLNVISLTVTAQDPGYFQTITIVHRMLGNSTEIQTIKIPKVVWSPPFNGYSTNYAVGIPANWTFLPMEIQTVDPNALISVYSTLIPTAQDYIGSANVSIALPSLAFYNQSITLRISAETRSLYQETVLWAWKQDRCGNGLRYSAAEQCDDGNLANGDGCSASCQVEPEALCTGGSLSHADICSLQPANCTTWNNCTDPVTNCTKTESNKNCTINCTNPITQDCTPVNCTETPLHINCTNHTNPCGNGKLDLGEECDDGNLINGDGCDQTCKKEPQCGNNIRESGETCDDGNSVSGDGCSAVCAQEPGWTCDYSQSQQRDICTFAISRVQSSTAESYFDYQYMGVGFGFPFVALLISAAIAIILLRTKVILSPIWLAAGFCSLITMLQLLFLLSEIGLEDFRAQIFAGFRWSHLRFSLDYPPFHDRLLVGLESDSRVRFLDYSLVFLLIALAAGLTHAVCRIILRQWGCLDDWARVYFILFQLTHIPVIYYAVQSLTRLSDVISAYDILNITAALVVLVLILGALLLYILTFRKAWGADTLQQSARSILCPGVKQPEEKLVRRLPLSSAAPPKSPEPPKRLCQSFDETSVKDNNGGEKVEEEETAKNRLFSADNTQRKEGKTPDFSSFYSAGKPVRVQGQLRTCVYLLQFAETSLSAVVFAAGSTRLKKVVSVLLLELIVAGFLIWQRPFLNWRYNVMQSCLRITFAGVLFLQALESEIDEAVTIAFVFLLLIGIFAGEICECRLLLQAFFTRNRTPIKQLPPVEDQGQPDVRAFTLNADADYFSPQAPSHISNERHSSSEESVEPGEVIIEN